MSIKWQVNSILHAYLGQIHVMLLDELFNLLGGDSEEGEPKKICDERDFKRDRSNEPTNMPICNKRRSVSMIGESFSTLYAAPGW